MNHKMEQGAAVEWLLQALAGCARREVSSQPAVTTAAEVLAILKEAFSDQWGLSALLTAFHSQRQSIYECVLEYAQSLVMLSTKVKRPRQALCLMRCSRTVLLMDYTPRVCIATFNDL